MRFSLLLLFFSLSNMSQVCAQQSKATKEISRYWTDLYQTVEINSDKKRKFTIQGQFKIDSNDPAAEIVFYYLKNNNDENESPEYADVKKFSQEWEQLEIEGTLSEQTKSIELGAYCQNNGDFYFENFKLLIEDDNGNTEQFPLGNQGFEKKITADEFVPDWKQGESDGMAIRIKEFTLKTIYDDDKKSQVLMLKGEGIDSKPEAVGGEGLKGRTVEIEGMISMLNDLKERVESQVKGLSQYELDHLHDEDANRIGALIMHLAAAEAYYQVFTFENRGFNDEEKEKWQIALSLDKEAREKFQGKDLQYYLDIYNEVRSKTIEELRKKDDVWFKEVQRSYNWTNQYCWFHVMEHQSSHLGQILFLKKRIPPKTEIAIPDEIKD